VSTQQGQLEQTVSPDEISQRHGMRMLPLILSANGTGILKWWVDAAFAVQPNMQGHSGGGLSLKRGFPIVSSIKQKLNTRSSTESEIVGADNFMPAICWTRYFMEAQGYQVQNNILFQDNKSTILLEKNGKALSSKGTKHVNIRNFFITDHVDKGDISLVWCPTGNMIGDFMTKPLQGALFQKFRDQIMGVVPAQDPGPGKSKTKIDEMYTHTDKPTKGKELKPSRGKSTIYNLVPSKEKGQHHRSVLGGEVTRTKDGRSKNLTRTRNISPKCNKQATNKILSHFYQLI
jgi:hypothetical protein